MIVLIETGWLAFYWTPLIVGLTYVAAAAASGGRGSLWAPGLMLVASGMAMALWLENGRSTADLEFLGVTVLGLGAGGVLAAFMTRAGYDITAMSLAMTVMAFGGFVLAAQHELPGVPASALERRHASIFVGKFLQQPAQPFPASTDRPGQPGPSR